MAIMQLMRTVTRDMQRNASAPKIHETNKLRPKLEQGVISICDEAPICSHGVFHIPKDEGYVTDKVCAKCKYNSVDTVVEWMEQGDYLATVDIKDAYQVVTIHP